MFITQKSTPVDEPSVPGTLAQEHGNSFPSPPKSDLLPLRVLLVARPQSRPGLLLLQLIKMRSPSRPGLPLLASFPFLTLVRSKLVWRGGNLLQGLRVDLSLVLLLLLGPGALLSGRRLVPIHVNLLEGAIVTSLLLTLVRVICLIPSLREVNCYCCFLVIFTITLPGWVPDMKRYCPWQR